MKCYTHCTQPLSRPPLTHTSAGDSWTLLGKSGSVSCGVTAPFSWALVHTTFCLCPPRVYFPVLCKFWLYGGVNDDLHQEGLCHNRVCCNQSPCPCGSPLLTHTSIGDAPAVLSQSLWGPWVLVHIRFVWAFWASLVGMNFILNLNSPLLLSCWDFSDLTHGTCPRSHSRTTQAPLQPNVARNR